MTSKELVDRLRNSASIEHPCSPGLARKAADEIERLRAPIPMILYCPSCGEQHIDAPDDRTPDWKNPPHKSHLCHGCGTIWRPADVPTVGVTAIASAGKADTWSPSVMTARAAHEPLPVQFLDVHAICDERDRLRQDVFNLAHKFMNEGRAEESAALSAILSSRQPPGDDARDAARYRWLRRHVAPSVLERITSTPKSLIADKRPEALDAEVDLRIAGKTGAGVGPVPTKSVNQENNNGT